MSDIFDVVPQQTYKHAHTHKNHSDTSSYIKLQAQFLTTSLGHYTIKFTSMIAQEAISRFSPLKTINVNKFLREIVKKYFLSDLELVYVGHIADLLDWNINSGFISNKSKRLNFQVEGQPRQAQLFLCFVNLVAFFVKKYIGQLQEYKAIAEYLHSQSQGEWDSIYEEWLKTIPKSIFKLSPRDINLVYSKYTRNCQQSGRNKNYNLMVDQIMELSTTYAMIPGETKEVKRKKGENKTINILNQEKDQEKDLIEPYLFGRKIFKPDQVSQLDFSKRSDIKMYSEISNEFMGPSQPATKPKIKLGHKAPKQSQINNTVTDFFSQKRNNEPVVNKRYAPQSTIGFVDPNPGLNLNLFDSKLFSSGSEIIPYPLRSNSNIFRSKLFE